jgi:hypothetical protein
MSVQDVAIWRVLKCRWVLLYFVSSWGGGSVNRRYLQSLLIERVA